MRVCAASPKERRVARPRSAAALAPMAGVRGAVVWTNPAAIGRAQHDSAATTRPHSARTRNALRAAVSENRAVTVRLFAGTPGRSVSPNVAHWRAKLARRASPEMFVPRDVASCRATATKYAWPLAPSARLPREPIPGAARRRGHAERAEERISAVARRRARAFRSTVRPPASRAATPACASLCDHLQANRTASGPLQMVARSSGVTQSPS
jgi:hypothetical protein